MASYDSDNPTYYYTIQHYTNTYTLLIINSQTNKLITSFSFIPTSKKAHQRAKQYIKTLSQPN